MKGRASKIQASTIKASTIKASTGRRRGAERKGRIAESAAALYYALAGYRILARRFKTPQGELDIVACKNDTVIFVEVKARATLGDAVDAVTPRARRRIEAGGRIFLGPRKALRDHGVRYDIICVAGWRLSALKDAWREGE